MIMKKSILSENSNPCIILQNCYNSKEYRYGTLPVISFDAPNKLANTYINIRVHINLHLCHLQQHIHYTDTCTLHMNHIPVCISMYICCDLQMRLDLMRDILLSRSLTFRLLEAYPPFTCDVKGRNAVNCLYT